MGASGLRYLGLIFVSVFSALAGGCVTTNPTPQVVQGGPPSDDGFLTVIVAPGQGRSCVGSPCSVYFKVPELGGEVEVVANNFSLGSFPSGRIVSLGQYNDSVRIMVRGADLPLAFVNIPRDAR